MIFNYSHKLNISGQILSKFSRLSKLYYQLGIKLNLKNIEKFICVFGILLVAWKFLVMKTEHIYASSNAGILLIKLKLCSLFLSTGGLAPQILVGFFSRGPKKKRKEKKRH
jgi:hypothetical protein